jgi:gas vesicle protein
VSRRGESDASLPIGLVLGMAIGAAIAIILEPKQGQKSLSERDEEVRRSEQALNDKRQVVRAKLDNLYKGTPIKPKSDMAEVRFEVTQAQQHAHDANEAVQKAQESLQKDLGKDREQLTKAEQKAHETNQEVQKAEEQLREAKQQEQDKTPGS